MPNEQGRRLIVARFIASRLSRLAVVPVVCVLFLVPAAARASQPLVVHHASHQAPATSRPSVAVRDEARLAVDDEAAARIRPVLARAPRVLSVDQVVRVVPRARDGFGLRAPPVGDSTRA